MERPAKKARASRRSEMPEHVQSIIQSGQAPRGVLNWFSSDYLQKRLNELESNLSKLEDNGDGLEIKVLSASSPCMVDSAHVRRCAEAANCRPQMKFRQAFIIPDVLAEKLKALCPQLTGVTLVGQSMRVSANVRTHIFVCYMKLHRNFDNSKEVSHICGNGQLGCVSADHLLLESHAINMQRNRCETFTACRTCGGSFVGNACSGHKDEGKELPKCLVRRAVNPCSCIAARNLLDPVKDDSATEYSDSETEYDSEDLAN